MNKLLAVLLGLALIGCAGTSGAGTLADLAVVDRSTGQRLPTYYHQGRYWVAGTPGNKYAVSVGNRSGQRVMTVISVDGVNVVTGEAAAPAQDGYVLEGGMRYEITGWRKSTEEVAAFVFTALPDSYAARTGRPGNVGVIGVAVFREWAPPRPAVVPPMGAQPRPYSHADALSSERAAAGEMARAPREERLGTGHGERENSQVGYTTFRRASDRPSEVLSIYYDSHANLVARGIIRTAIPVTPSPNPFPAGLRFVPDPRG
jgi:hypothetical protein